MKTLYLTLIAALTLSFTGMASAENSWKEDWKERMMSEKIAFLTVELGITPEEAQAFWPVYNEVNNERDEAMKNVFLSFKALEDVMNAEKSEKEISKALEKYIDSLEKQRKVEDEAAEKYRKVLSTEKLAKLYVGEEKFRRQHIRRLHGGQEGRR